MRKIDCQADVIVEITIKDEDAIERVTGPNGDRWREQVYELYTRDQIIRHWTFNATMRGVERVNELDGWADMDNDAVTFQTHFSGLIQIGESSDDLTRDGK